jgi:hypothetical protein
MSTAIIERTLSTGTTLKLKLEPLQNEQVRILEYWRKPRRGVSFRRVKDEEGKIVAFTQLNLAQSYTDLFEAS